MPQSQSADEAMPTEIEIKLSVESHEPLRERLRALGAEFIGKGLETNRIFDLPDGSLRRRGMGLRARQVTSDATHTTSATLTVKGPRTSGAVKSREEREVSVADADAAAAILHMLGYAQILQYEKRRETWSYRNCLVELDEPARLSTFVEIEGPTTAAVKAVRKALDLEHARAVDASYVRLMMEYCEDHGITHRHVCFP